MKILVTGSCGFIGSNLIRHTYHSKLNHQIVSIDKLIYSHTKHNIYLNKSHQFYLGDICDAHFLNNIFEIERPDVVLHLAAESHVDHSISSASPFVMSNVLGTQNIVDQCVKNKIKLLYVSTDEIYGQLKTENDSPWLEDSLPAPRNPYSASKLSGELLVKAAHETHGLQYIITRCCNNMGPRQSARNFIPKVIKNILNNEKVPIYGQGSEIRTWISVFDHASAILFLIENDIKNDIFNVGTNWEISNLELFYQISKLLNKGSNLLEFVENRKGHDFRYALSSKKLRELGWEPKYTFKSALEKTVEWYTNNQWFLS